MAVNVPNVAIAPEPKIVNRWVQMCAGIVAMMAIANLQYAWTLFTKPLTSNLHATLAAVQIAFAAFIFCETWLVPFEGYLIDRLGPRLVIGIGGILVGAGWIGSGYANTTTGLYIWYAIGGIGAGAVYGGCTGNVLKWFPDHRGLCAGIVSGAYGIGTAVTVAPIESMIKASGYRHAFIFWGILQGIIVTVAAMFIVAPPKGWFPKNWHPVARVRQSLRDMTWLEMVKQPSFYVIYIMMTMVAFGGLVVTAQLKEIASFYKVDKVIVAWGLSASILAIQLNRIVNGVTRPLWGWISDHIGRENAMFSAFLIEGLAVWAWLQAINRPVMFVLLSSVVFFAWGEIFSLFPSITADLYGRKWATTNYGIVYTAKGTAAIFSAPVAAYVMLKTGSWVPVFYVMIACDIIAAFMALLWLKPVARRTIEEGEKLGLEAGRLVPGTKSAQVSKSKTVEKVGA
ncbi:MAG TPA: oxalate/formate MFS antiporter [Terriglobales bacterium]|nr:oxalate/formate MFS antiporter [Terriglobales bacterium]